jgi:hypothetical protein
MHSLLALAVSLTLAPDNADTKTATVTVTAEVACLHCTFGEGDGCEVCLKLNDKTPLLLAGPAVKQLFPMRLEKKVVVATGALSINKDKRMVLSGAKARVLTATDKDAPAKGTVRVQGIACCGRCDLGLCDECTMAIKNGKTPIVLDGAKASQKVEEPTSVRVVGTVHIDRRGLLRLDAAQVQIDKK